MARQLLPHIAIPLIGDKIAELISKHVWRAAPWLHPPTALDQPAATLGERPATPLLLTSALCWGRAAGCPAAC
jgi:hypothetical protein